MQRSRIFGLRILALFTLICAAEAFASTPPHPNATADQQAKPQKGAAYQFEKVKEWCTAAIKHEPGKADDAAKQIGRWPLKDLEIVIHYVSKLSSQPKSAIKRALAKARIRRALDVTDEEARNGDLSRIVKRGVNLHTDIALLELQAWAYQDIGETSWAYVDGRTLIQPKRYHWAFARQLIDSLSPTPSQDPTARQWYVSTTAYMQNHRLLGYARQNIERALNRFPSDDRVLFYAGVLHEVWASPVNQNVALPKGGKATFGTKESELKLAHQFLQKSIEVNPGFAEARLHLGRVLGLLGQPARAAAELQRAAAEVNDPALSYYASLFLGHENWKMTRWAEAREHYENAAKLFPMAQSPLLALSQMERVRGNAKDALATLQRALNLPHIDIWEDDPWWIYDLAHVRDADGRIKEMQQALGGLSR